MSLEPNAPEARALWKAFYTQANRSLLHHLDIERLNFFIVECHVRAEELSGGDLDGLLQSSGGWDTATANRVCQLYRDGRDLLKAYDSRSCP
jgi:hypothetical protein